MCQNGGGNSVVCSVQFWYKSHQVRSVGLLGLVLMGYTSNFLILWLCNEVDSVMGRIWRRMAAFTQNWKSDPPHLTMERGLGICLNINSVVIPSARQFNKRNVSIGTKWSRNSTAQTRDVCGRVCRQLRTTKRRPDTSRTPTYCFQTT